MYIYINDSGEQRSKEEPNWDSIKCTKYARGEGGGRGGGPLKYPEESDGLVTGQKKNKRVLSSGACGMSQY